MGKFGKAVYATVVGFISPLVVTMVGDTSFSSITAGQWLTAALAAIVAGGGVYGISNAPQSTT